MRRIEFLNWMKKGTGLSLLYLGGVPQNILQWTSQKVPLLSFIRGDTGKQYHGKLKKLAKEDVSKVSPWAG
jgi:hypothetical protein